VEVREAIAFQFGHPVGNTMSTIKSYSVGNGDMFYVNSNSDNFSIIDCCLNEDESSDNILKEISSLAAQNGVCRFICTHPDDDHFRGIKRLDESIEVMNFYCVNNQAVKSDETESFTYYNTLRDTRAFYIYKGCRRKWMNLGDDERATAGISILWPDVDNEHFKAALADCDAGNSYNNTSAVIQYSLEGGATVMWLGDLETEFMESISDSINLQKTTVVFASHHGRASGKIPDSWLEKLDPQIIVIGEAPSRHLHYYTGYKTITQNSCGDLTMDIVDDKVHFYVSNPGYTHAGLTNMGQSAFDNYIGSITVETEYTL